MVAEFLDVARAVVVSLVHLAEGRLARWLRQLRYLHCSLLRGHDEYLQFQKNRLSLKCLSCGHETPGWGLDRKSPLVPFPTERRRTYAPRISDRRIA
jgi:hypothetical protein